MHYYLPTCPQIYNRRLDERERRRSFVLERGLLRPGGVIVADNVGPMFGANAYVPWMRARSDFASEYVSSHLEYQSIEDGVLVSRHLGATV